MYDWTKKQTGEDVEKPKYCGSCSQEILMSSDTDRAIGWVYIGGVYRCCKCHGDIFERINLNVG